MSTPSGNPARFIRLNPVIQKTGYSRSTIYAKIPRGEFPAPIKIGARAVAWIESEIDAWISERVKASRGDTTVGEVV